MRVVITGAGGFIGGHLTGRLLENGADVTAVDIAPVEAWHQRHPAANTFSADVRDTDLMRQLFRNVDVVYQLAADMGGMGFIENNKLACMLTVETSVSALKAAAWAGVGRVFYSSSACVYAAEHQSGERAVPLTESMAYPAMPEDGYGWEKLFTERLCRHYREDVGLATRIGRYHNVYGPRGTFTGGREKAPAAICRKVAEAVITGRHEIEIWGDGEQTRSFLYVDDCVEGTLRLAASDVTDPLNIGSSELVSINELVSIVEKIAGVTLDRVYRPDAPQGVRGRNSDNTLTKATLGWEPSVSLVDGLERTYQWVHRQVEATAPVLR